MALTRQYFAALSDESSSDRALAFYSPNIVQQEFPNRFMPNGAIRDLAQIKEASERGKLVMGNQTYEILNIVANGNSVAVEFLWSGVAKIDLGTLAAGSVMKGRFASFIDFQNGFIVSQRSYDCFDPW